MEDLRSVLELARTFHVTKRAVLNWFDAGCPHEKGVNRGREARFAREADVREWRRRQGMVDRGRTDAPAARPGLPGPPAAGVAVGGAGKPVAMIGDCVEKLSVIVSRLMAEDVSNLTIAEKQKLAGAVKNSSAELRQLVEALHSVRERENEFVPRARASEEVRQLAAVVRTGAQALPVELADEAFRALQGLLLAGAADEARRVLVAAARSACDVYLGRVADQAEATARFGEEHERGAA